MEDAGYVKVDFSAPANFYVINTCSVTENADKECKYLVRQIKRRSPDAKIIIMGCYAQLKPEEIASIEGVSMVLGASEKFNLAAQIEKLHDQDSVVCYDDYKAIDTFHPAYNMGDRTRTFLKIQDGCDYFCAFCTIPMARGKSRSASIAETVEQAKKAAQSGVKEIVLTGVNTGDFGKSLENFHRSEETFFDLIQELEKIESVQRWRISSIEPNLLTDDIIRYVAASKKFMPHFHIPLQSGSDTILKLMHRKYDTSLYRNKIALIKKLIPIAAIGVDVIVGFPGETEEAFMETFNFLHEIDFSYLHVFTYSERNNTKALKIEPIVPIETRRLRNKQLRNLSDKKWRAFMNQFLHTKREVLFETENDNGFMNGYTDNYIRVRLPYDQASTNEIIPVHIQEIHALGYATNESKQVSLLHT